MPKAIRSRGGSGLNLPAWSLLTSLAISPKARALMTEGVALVFGEGGSTFLRGAPLAALAPGRVDPAGTAVFLDFDGTLVEIASHPDLVELAPATRAALSRLQAVLGGALAIITGRGIADIDRFLSPLVLPVAGVHGLERRSHNGDVRSPEVDTSVIKRIAGRLGPFVDRHQGLLLETKAASVALHYRLRPELEADATAAMDAALEGVPGVHVLRGKMVLEAKADDSDKGRAVIEYLAEAPFAGRQPLFAGDDVTDEDAFGAVNAHGGISVKIGPGETCARYRADSTREFLSWLNAVAKRFDDA